MNPKNAFNKLNPKPPARPKAEPKQKFYPHYTPTTPRNFDKGAFEPLAANDEPETGLVDSILELKEGMCKWPIRDKWCGCKAQTGKPYCAQHAYISRGSPLPKSEKRRVRAFWR